MGTKSPGEREREGGRERERGRGREGGKGGGESIEGMEREMVTIIIHVCIYNMYIVCNIYMYSTWIYIYLHVQMYMKLAYHTLVYM